MKAFLPFFFLTFAVFSYGQNNQELSSALKDFQSQLTDVETKSSTFSQVLSWDKDQPYKAKLSIEETSKKKGKTKTSSFSFNFQDIDINAIHPKTTKDIVEVTAFMKSKQKMIAFTKEGEFKAYVFKMTFLAEDMDAGRKMEKTLTKIIKIAQKLPSACPIGATTAIQWMAEHIATVSSGEINKKQSFNIDKQPIIDLSTETTGKKRISENWLFNLADLNKRSITLQIKSKEFFVEVKTKRNLKYIYYNKNGEKTTYIKSIKLYTADFEDAKCLVTALELAIEDSEKKEKEKFQKYTSAQSAIDVVAKGTTNVEIKKGSISQKIQADCITEFEVTEQKEKSDAKTKNFKLNFMDINPKNVKISIKSDQILIDLSTGKNKLIQNLVDGEITKYTNKLSITVPTIEDAKTMQYAVQESARLCHENPKFTAYNSTKENLDWITKALTEHPVKDSEQSLERLDSDCKWKFISIKSGKKSLEEIFEFSLEDLDKKGIKWKVSGKKLFIEIHSKHKEKSIKYYKNSEPNNYKNTFVIQLPDVETARNTILAFQKAIESCQ